MASSSSSPVMQVRLLGARAAFDREHLASVVDEPAAVTDGFRDLPVVAREPVLAPVAGEEQVARLREVALRLVARRVRLGGRHAVGAGVDRERGPVVLPRAVEIPCGFHRCVRVRAVGVAVRRQVAERDAADQRIGRGGGGCLRERGSAKSEQDKSVDAHGSILRRGTRGRHGTRMARVDATRGRNARGTSELRSARRVRPAAWRRCPRTRRCCGRRFARAQRRRVSCRARR